MRVPLLDLRQQFREVEDEVRAAIDRVLTTQEYILGSEADAFEKEAAVYCAARHAVAVSNGSDAIVASLMTLGIGPGDEVIVPTFTFFATAGCVARVGARPVFVDILPDTFNIDPAAVEAAITPRTRAIIPVHLYGQCADMDRLMAIARRHNLLVVEDAAQAIGATWRGTSAGSFGIAGTISFYPTKNLSAIGEAGLVVSNDDAFATKLRQIRNHGQSERYFHHYIGGNFRMDGIQAAALRVKMRHLPDWTEARRRRAARYSTALAGTPITCPVVNSEAHHVFHQYTIRAPQRDALRAHLAEAGVATGLYYPLPLHLQPCFDYLGFSKGQFPVAERAVEEVVSLPISPEMSEAQQEHVVQSILAFY